MGIGNINTDWEGYSGKDVEDFIKSQFRELTDRMDGKFGYAEFIDGKIVFYDNANKETVVGSIPLSGNYVVVNLDTETPSSFYVITSEEHKYIAITPSSEQGSLGSAITSELMEDYRYVVSADNGKGFREVENGTCIGGNSINLDIIPYNLTSGLNRIKVAVTGMSSGESKYIVFTANVTSLALTSNFAWQIPWEEGNQYSINGLKFSGNLIKELHIKIGDKQYDREFAVGTNYTTTSYSYILDASELPSATGVYDVDVWMTGGGVSSKRYKYQIMCVRMEDISKATLVCVNNVAHARNYEESSIFSYAVYNATKVNITSSYIDKNGEHSIASKDINVTPREQIPFPIRLDVDSTQTSGLKFRSVVRTIVGENSYETEVVTDFDNTNTFSAAEGAVFSMNPSLRDNTAADKEAIYNNADTATVGRYDAGWSNMSWASDGWIADDMGIKSLIVKAGGRVKINNFKPLANANTGSLTFEVMFRTSNISNYDKPIFSIIDTEEYDEATSNGFVVLPNRIMVLGTGYRNLIEQSVLIDENQICHCAIVFQRGYGDTNRNICMIYINGVRQKIFEYGGQAQFGNGLVVIGQESADVSVYSMRQYNKVLEQSNIFGNYLNVFIGDSKQRQSYKKQNEILENGNVDYNLVSKLPFNTLVLEMDNDHTIPQLDGWGKKDTVMGSISLHYNDMPTWDVTIKDIPIGGQGTTSMMYAKWNFRGKSKKGVTKFIYADGTVDENSGYIAGRDNPKVSKITGKKNVASSPQGHKMGATGLYDALYAQLDLKKGKPYENARVAVYQYPFLGFQKFSDGTYKFVGLYTVGPDKGDDNTFGYTKDYPDLLSLEGPNHAPLGTRFLHPWIDGAYNEDAENYEFGGQEAWDCDKANVDPSAIGALMEQEWKPAYDIVYYCSPFLIPLSESGYSSLADLNAHISEFQNGFNVFVPNRKNEVLQLYTSDYKIIYYRNKTKQYEVLPEDANTHGDIIAYLDGYLTNRTNPTKDEIIDARKAKFRAEMDNCWNKQSCLFHDCFCELIGASDNDAKNTYPFKFNTLADGGRWEWRQDDLDSIGPTDNNGESTKSYSIEQGDVTDDGTDVFQGASSALWTLIRTVFAEEKRTMMYNVVNAMLEIASDLNITEGYSHDKVFGVLKHFFFDRSALYFPQMSYNEDGKFAYIDVWASDPNKSYNNVYPLAQAQGSQYEAEKLWFERRAMYILSKYSLLGFTGANADGYGVLSFTPAIAYPIEITPAIDMYPSGNSGGGEDALSNIRGDRTKAGEVCIINTTASGDTGFNIKAMDYIVDLGDLSGLKINSRGADTTGINFQVSSKRLRRLNVGNDNADNVLFNATKLTVDGECIEDINARNVATLNSDISLLKCPRLRTADFSGNTGIKSMLLPVGGKIERVVFPDDVNSIMLHSLPFVTLENLVFDGKKITSLYFNRCKSVNALEMLHKVYDDNPNLRFITIIWDGVLEGTANELRILSDLATKYDAETDSGFGRVLFSGEIISNDSSAADIQGGIAVDYAYKVDIDKLKRIYGNTFNVVVNKEYYVWMADDEVRRLMVAKYGDGDGITTSKADTITTLDALFTSNTNIVSFDELSEFHNLTIISGSTFANCTSLETCDIPQSVTGINEFAFDGCTKLSCEINLPNLTYLSWGTFRNTSITKIVSLGEITILNERAFHSCTKLTSAVLPNTLKSIYSGTFANCTSLETCDIPQSVTGIRNTAFYGCTKLSGEINLPNLTYLDYWAFKDTSITKIVSLGEITILNEQAFHSCTKLTSAVLPNTLKSIYSGTFANCTSLETCDIPQSVTGISNTAFYGCTKLSGEINLPNLTYLDYWAFKDTSITKIVSLGEITILNEQAFYNCTKLTSAVLPNTLKSIYSETFANCTELKKMILNAVDAPTIVWNTFSGTTACQFYVPDDSVDVYKAASGWSDYASRIHPISEYTE